ncbi:DUF2637 domain-containing protein [Streptomyces sp. NBC_01619]|uniref:DUF2637 domain-containing protein n=1 Tax=Streptomyces sp. NBC_01619 TaxID=2975901 RepID=UPI00225AE298|nr:DUF2637 domain-containing protein [Streptomyces sp. NBC_01619]MCX4515991.1 DUF2637 domain-containing protein [Streptomyces sp. NBC_01619]
MRRPRLTRVHRILIGVVVAGAVIIAAIGFAGSYAAVRELAEQKGFGDFSLVFPIGIDAGICVLLALDLLLTWIRIPFPLLRQTAWLLTAATIAFNGAAAWPDPLGVGMHAVIPVLFVVSVEAARHAVGRIADITADKHMEGVRLTRWLLSPIPTFRLWRRMKLWELRSYEQVIKLEQDRLIYQARLKARYGRAWRRKAPIEALMPLRLARYGVPLAETAPAGLAAAAIDTPMPFRTVERDDSSVHTSAGAREPLIAETEIRPMLASATSPGTEAPRDASAPPSNGEPASEIEQGPLAQDPQRQHPHIHGVETATDSTPETVDDDMGETWDDFVSRAWHEYANAYSTFPDTEHFATFLAEQHGVLDTEGRPLSTDVLDDSVQALWQREFHDAPPSSLPANEHLKDDAEPDPMDAQPPLIPAGAVPAQAARGPQVAANVGEAGSRDAGEGGSLTKVDGYFLAWREYQQQHGGEPTGKDLSAYLAQKGVLGRGERPVSPSTLRRYFLNFRLYSVWSEHRMRRDQPSAETIAQDCAARGITAQYNEPITGAYITAQADDFERRWQALTSHHAAATS